MKYFIIIMCLLGGVIGCVAWLQTTTVYGQSTMDVTTSETGVEGRQVLAWLNQLKAIRLDINLFDDPRYKSLADFTVDIGEQPIGRDNPFLPADSTIRNQAVNIPTIVLPQQ